MYTSVVLFPVGFLFSQSSKKGLLKEESERDDKKDKASPRTIHPRKKQKQKKKKKKKKKGIFLKDL